MLVGLGHVSTDARSTPWRLIIITSVVTIAVTVTLALTFGRHRNQTDTTPAQRVVIEQLISVLLHDTETIQYDQVVDLYDGRGYSSGRADFSTAGGEALAVINAYTLQRPDNVLAQYVPAL